MTEQKKSCGECHWWRNGRFEYHANGIAGNCITPMADSLMSIGTMRGDEGSHCPAFRQRGERLPQRFKVWLSGGWSFGICWPMKSGRWAINLLTMHDTFDGDPSDSLKILIGDAEVVWIDNDYGWSGK